MALNALMDYTGGGAAPTAARDWSSYVGMSRPEFFNLLQSMGYQVPQLEALDPAVVYGQKSTDIYDGSQYYVPPPDDVRDKYTGYNWGQASRGNDQLSLTFDPSGNLSAINPWSRESDSAWLGNTLLNGAAFVGGSALGANALFGGLGSTAALGSLPEVAATSAPAGYGGLGATQAVASGAGLPLSAEAAGLTGTLGYGGLGATEAVAGGAGLGSALGTGAAAGSWIPGISNSTVLGGGLALGGALIGANATDKAAQAQRDAAAQANATQRYIFDTLRADNQPLVDMRNSVLPKINALLSNPSSITSDPGYQFQLNEGNRLLQSGAAARGMTYSGDQGKALTRYGQDYAGTKLDQSLNRLTNIAGLGQVGSNNNQNAATNYGNNVSATQQNVGNTNASAYIGGANIWNNALGSIGNSLQLENLLQRYGRP